MKQTNWNILWLDDEPEKMSSWIEEIQDKYEDIFIKQVAFVDICEQEIVNNPGFYHAVILDANGKYSNQPYGTPSLKGFTHLVRMVKPIMPVYIFSGELQLGSDDSIDGNSGVSIVNDELEREGFVEGENLFDKNYDWRPLYQRLYSDLQTRFSVFSKYPEVKDAVIRFGVHEQSAKELLLWLEDHSNPFPAYDALRRVTFDDAFETEVRAFFQIPKGVNIDKNLIKKYCMEPWEKAIILNLYKDIINNEVHNWPSNKIHVQEVIAHAALITLCWFDRFMQKRLDNPNPADYYKGAKPLEKEKNNVPSLESSNNSIFTPSVETSAVTSRAQKDDLPTIEDGVIEQDKNGCYHVGPYLLNANFAQRFVGKKVKVIEHKYLKSNLQYKEWATVQFID